MRLIVRHLGCCAYSETLALQDNLVTRKQAGAADDYLLLLEHEPVYTLGRGADTRDLQDAGQILSIPVYRVSRGGGVTFHGPGQLVAYPIIALRHRGRDVHRYVSDLETVLIGVCADFGVGAQRRPGAPGVWARGAKIASIGVGIRRWITFHGVALNVSTDLSFFAQIVPCHMPDVRMTSIVRERGSAPSMVDVCASFARHFQATFKFPDALLETEARA